MIDLKIKAMPNNTEKVTALTEFIAFLQSINFVAVLLLIPAWNWISKYYQYKTSRDRKFIKEAAQEGVKDEMRIVNVKIDGIIDDIEALRKQQERDKEAFNKEIIQIIRDRK